MKNIKYALVISFLVLTGLWAMADTLLSGPLQFLAVRSSGIDYTGILAIGAMSLALILATRPVWMEPVLSGLDKMYRLHKWLGISALVAAVTHWIWTQSPGWLVGLGLLTLPPRRPRAPVVEEADSWLPTLSSLRHAAEGLGEWAFYISAALLVLALIKRFPYKPFIQTHKILAITYLALVFHSVVLMKTDWWSQPIGWVSAVLMVWGSVSAIRLLLKRAGQDRRVSGEVTDLEFLEQGEVLRVDMALQPGWVGHQAGQFAFVSFDDKEGPHPFTLSSAWAQDNKVSFLIKELGDYTRQLRHTLKVGSAVRVEGPYGQFNFEGAHPRQIWVAGGIGISPFVARLQALARQGGGQNVDLFHCVSVSDAVGDAKLKADSAAAQARLHQRVDARDGFLTAQRISELVPDWKDAEIWFCGPAGFGAALRRDFAAMGLPRNHFHQELFNMR